MLKKTCINGVVGHLLLQLKAEIYGADSFNKYFNHVVILTHPEAERAPCHTQPAEVTGECSLWRSAFWSPTQMSLITSHCFKFQFNRSASTAGCRSAGGATGQTGVCKVEASSYTPFASPSVSSRTGSSSFTLCLHCVCHPENWCRGPRTGAGRSQNCQKTTATCMERSQQHDITQWWPKTSRSSWCLPMSSYWSHAIAWGFEILIVHLPWSWVFMAPHN